VSQGLTAYGSKTWDEEKKKSWIEQRKQNVEAKKRAAERMREYRKNPETRKRNLARWMLNRKKQSGAIHSEPCTFCGKEETQAHHPDYDKPLLIVWLCGDCHRKVHPRTRKKQLYAGNAKAEGKEG
jgi:arylsulfatase A-like enzyme